MANRRAQSASKCRLITIKLLEVFQRAKLRTRKNMKISEAILSSVVMLGAGVQAGEPWRSGKRI